MKQKILIVLILIQLMSCNKEEVINEDPIDYHSTTLNITVDERIELLSVVQHFTTWANKRHTKLDLTYKSEIESYFRTYSNHEAIKLCQQLINKGFTYDVPPAFMLYHSALPEFKKEFPYKRYIINRAGSEYNLNNFANALRDFAQVSNFESFYDSHTDFYNQIIDSIKHNIPDFNYIELLEDYYGDYKSSYNLIVAPLFHAGGYGPKIYTDKGEFIYSINGPLDQNNGFPIYGDSDWFQYIILHEFSHSFVNHLTEINLNTLNNYQNLYTPIKDKMEEMAYTNWYSCINEHLVRVNVARMSAILYNDEKKEEILQYEYNKGFKYIFELDSAMSEYEQNRDTYKSYADFYSKIIEYFGRISDK